MTRVRHRRSVAREETGWRRQSKWLAVQEWRSVGGALLVHDQRFVSSEWCMLFSVFGGNVEAT